MSVTRVACGYTCPIVGNQSQTLLGNILSNVPLDLSLPQLWGLLPDSDVTSNPTSTSIRRLIRLNMGLGTAAITPNDAPGGNSFNLQSLTLGALTGYFAGVPIIRFSGGGSPQLQAIAYPVMGVSQIVISRGGTGYTGATTAALVGGNIAPGGTPAALGTITIAGGSITAVAVASPGSGYTTYPSLVFTDSGGGSGALAYGGLQIQRLNLQSPGRGYSSAPTITVVPLFQANQVIPPGETNDRTMAQWMTGQIQNALRSPVSPDVPQYV